MKVGLIQIGNKFGEQYYLPYSIGLWQAYLQETYHGDWDALLPIYKYEEVETIVESLLSADIIYSSIYVWNYQINLRINEQLAKHGKNMVLGGPQINKWQIPFDTPSPYLTGVFDPLMEANPEQEWAGLLETNRGCPFKCSFCYLGRDSQNTVQQFDINRVFDEIDWFSQHTIEFLFCCDANFGMFDRDLDIARKVAENKEKYGYPKTFSVQNTKNSTEKILEIQKVLNDAGLQKGVNLALQSLNGETLKSINRTNINQKTYRDLQHIFTENDTCTYTDLIIGLPGETYESFTDGVGELIDRGQHNRINFVNLTILPNTEMADPEYRDKHGMQTVQSNLVLHHTSLDEKTNEFHELVIATDTMPKEDWVRTKVFCWMISLLYFSKLLQLPFKALNELYSGIKPLIELFINQTKYPIISNLVDTFRRGAYNIQGGGVEYAIGKEWLNLWWPPDELAFIEICQDLNGFYIEAEAILNEELDPHPTIHDTIVLNKALIKLPFINTDITVFSNTINRTTEQWDSWEDWARKVVWYSGKQGAYLYECR